MPAVVGHAEQGQFRQLTLLHRVADDANAARERRGQRAVAVHLRHLEEVGVHVFRIDLAVGVVVAGVVPPPAHVASEILAHDVEIVAVGNTPHAPSRGVDGDVFGRGGEGREESAQIVGADPARCVGLGHEMQRTNRVGRSCSGLVVLRFQSALHGGEPRCVEFELLFAIRHSHVIDENGKLAHAEVVHLVEFPQNIVHHRIASEEVVSRMDGPDEVHLRGCRLLREVAHHVLREPAFFLLVGRDARGVGVLPVV